MYAHESRETLLSVPMASKRISTPIFAAAVAALSTVVLVLLGRERAGGRVAFADARS
jgi:hypothetical protein